MIETYLLEQLDAFARCGTLSAASEELHVSQPALTRSMKKIEELLGVKLFDRHKNRLFLNQTGELAAELAANLLQENKDFESRIRAYDRSLRTISFGSCAPVPSMEFTPVLQRLYQEMTIQSEIRSETELAAGLADDAYQIIVTHNEPDEGDDIYYKMCGRERLSIAVPPAHPLAAFNEISFADLEDVPILQLTRVGFWGDLVKSMIPNHHILLQDNEDTFNEIRQASALPTFHSDYFDSIQSEETMHRKFVTITDPESEAYYYLVCKRKDKKKFNKLFDNIPTWGI